MRGHMGLRSSKGSDDDSSRFVRPWGFQGATFQPLCDPSGSYERGFKARFEAGLENLGFLETSPLGDYFGEGYLWCTRNAKIKYGGPCERKNISVEHVLI